MRLPEVKSTKELESLAVALERRAAERYRLLAAAMASRGRADLQDLFTRLQHEEGRHEAAIRESAPDLDQTQLQAHWPPQLGEAPRETDANRLARLSLYDCLAEAVRNEMKAFRFFSYLAANTEDEALRRRAEALAKEELAHAALLRRARRAAYHSTRRRPRAWPLTERIQSLAKLQQAAAPRERALRQRIEASELAPTAATALNASGAEIEKLLGGHLQEGAAQERGTPAELSSLPLDADAEEAFDFYSKVAEEAAEEKLMLTAQRLSEEALKRIELLAASIS